jgi:hypothetical protein
LWKPTNLERTPNDYRKILDEDLLARVGGDVAIRKNATSATASPLIRQDLDPELYIAFVKRFPMWEFIRKIPSNGLTHAYNQWTTLPSAAFIAESGTVTDSQNTYVRATATNAVMSLRVGATLKSIFAVRQGGVNYDVEAREIEGGATALAYLAQQGLFRYQNTTSGLLATDIAGQYDVNSFNGLRYTAVNLSPAGNTFGPITPAPATNPPPILSAIRSAATKIVDAGGDAKLIVTSYPVLDLIVQEQLNLVRFVNTVDIRPGLNVTAISVANGLLPVLAVPGDSIGVVGTVSPITTDIWILDTDVVEWCYLGGPAPTILDIPTATDGVLRHLYVPFLMGGLVVNVPSFIARVRVTTG